MTRIVYVNGRYTNYADAHVHAEDRGFQFADGVYEYIAFFNRTLLDADLHLVRLERSLAGLEIPAPMPMPALALVIKELMARNTRENGAVYIQITRGEARRDHGFPLPRKPTLVMTVSPPKTPKPSERENGVSVITEPEIRWGRCDLKTVGLLPNVLAKQQAVLAKAREAWLVTPAGMVTEGAISNAFIIKNGTIITHPKTSAILSGIARDVALKLAQNLQIRVEERGFSLEEARAADEAFITSTSANVLPVTTLDGKPVGSGKVGPIVQKLMEAFHQHIHAQTGAMIS